MAQWVRRLAAFLQYKDLLPSLLLHPPFKFPSHSSVAGPSSRLLRSPLCRPSPIAQPPHFACSGLTIALESLLPPSCTRAPLHLITRALWCDDRGPWQRRASLIGHAVPLHRCRGGQLERRCNHSEANGTASTPRCPWMRVLPWQRRRRNPGSSDDRAGAQLLARPMTEMPHRERA